MKFTRTSRWVPSFCEDWVFYQVALSNEDEAKANEVKEEVKEDIKPAVEEAKE